MVDEFSTLLCDVYEKGSADFGNTWCRKIGRYGRNEENIFKNIVKVLRILRCEPMEHLRENIWK